MSANLHLAILDRHTAARIIPENTPLRESSGSAAVENTRIVEVAFKPADTHFRESLAKPPRKRPNAERRSREFLTPAEVDMVPNPFSRLTALT